MSDTGNRLGPVRLAITIVMFGAAVTLPVAAVMGILLLLGAVALMLYSVTCALKRLRQWFKSILTWSGQSA
jgi:hypothetical protein